MTEYLFVLSVTGIPDSANQARLYKLALDGTEEWYTGSGLTDEDYVPIGPVAVTVDPSGYVFVAVGMYGSWDMAEYYAGRVAKYYADGEDHDAIWAVDVFSDLAYTDSTQIRCIAAMPNGNVVVGFERTEIDGTPYTLACLDGDDGSVLWLVDTGADSSVESVCCDTSSNVYACGDANSDDDALWVYDEDGNELWTSANEMGDFTFVTLFDEYVYATGPDLDDVGQTFRFALADGAIDEEFITPELEAFDSEGNGYVAFWVDTWMSGLVGRLPASFIPPEDWYVEWEEEPVAIAVTTEGHVFALSAGSFWGTGSVYCYEADSGDEVTDGWPYEFNGEAGIASVASSYGLPGAFPDEWGLPGAPSITVGDVLYE